MEVRGKKKTKQDHENRGVTSRDVEGIREQWKGKYDESMLSARMAMS
jgi:hypothetical protein